MNDPRYIKTENKIQKAFWELVAKYGFVNIKVKDLIKYANITRTTFYSHYANKDELLQQSEKELLNGLTLADLPLSLYGIQHNIKKSRQEVHTHLLQMSNYLFDHGEQFYLLLSNKGDPVFASKLLNHKTRYTEDKRIHEELPIAPEYLFPGIIGMVTNLIVQWVRRGFTETPAEFATILDKMIIPIISSK